MENNEDCRPETTDEIKKLYADFIAEIHKREVSSSENFDKSILTFSSAGLALSVGFLKDFIPIQLAEFSCSLYCSWILFTIATCSTMMSFLISGWALSDQKKLAYSYYIERNEEAFEKENKWNSITQVLNYLSGGAFICAMILTVLFISLNLEKGSVMKQLNENFKHMKMQNTSSGLAQKGLTVPNMQPVPNSSQSQQSATNPQSSCSTTTKK